MTLAPLLLTGGPAAGKSSTALALAATTVRTAFIDVDDIRQLVKNGGAAPWDGPEGTAQQQLGVRNAANLATNFLAAGINVTIADVVNSTTLALYRELLPSLRVIRLALGLEEARRRATQRPVFLTDVEFDELHHQQAASLKVDHELPVAGFPRGAGRSGACLLYTSPIPRELSTSRMPASA